MFFFSFQISVPIRLWNCAVCLVRVWACRHGRGNNSWSTAHFLTSCKQEWRKSEQVSALIEPFENKCAKYSHVPSRVWPCLCSAGSLGMKELKRVLFEHAVDSMFIVNQTQVKITFKSMALLQASSCFGNHKASLLLATIHLSGLGHVVNQQQVQSLPSFNLNCRFCTV